MMMLNTAHLIETALLVLAAYLSGCVLGYGIRRVLHAARGTRQVTAIAAAPIVHAAPDIKRPRSPAARLAARVDDEMPPAPVVAPPRLPQQQALVATKPAPVPRHAKAKALDPKPLALTAPRSGMADNLKQIRGIGPKIEASLNGLGIYHFDQIAGWTKANVDWVDEQLAFNGRIGRERWVEQATAMTKRKIDA